MIKLTGLWVNKDKNGQQYFSGTLGGAKVLIFKNGHKEEDKHPDYNLYISEKPEQKQGESKETGDFPF